jgi:hypothetical protein
VITRCLSSCCDISCACTLIDAQKFSFNKSASLLRIATILVWVGTTPCWLREKVVVTVALFSVCC